jgi:hypothetical protein
VPKAAFHSPRIHQRSRCRSHCDFGGRIVNPGAVGIAAGAVKRRRRAYLLEAGGFVETTVYDRDRLGAGVELAGPQPWSRTPA